MPPYQCPSCGRFLKAALIASLEHQSAACPGCQQPLVASDFTDVAASTSVMSALTTSTPAGNSASAPGHEVDHNEADHNESDHLEAEVDRDVVDDLGAPTDVLQGWDPDGPPSRWLDDQPPFPTDMVAVAGAAVVGALVAAVLGRRKVRAGMVGAILGAVGAGIARQIWRLDD